MRVPRYLIVVRMTASNGQRNSSQIAKERGGTLAFVSSLRFSFVNSSKQLILKTSCFNQLVSALHALFADFSLGYMTFPFEIPELVNLYVFLLTFYFRCHSFSPWRPLALLIFSPPI